MNAFQTLIHAHNSANALSYIDFFNFLNAMSILLSSYFVDWIDAYSFCLMLWNFKSLLASIGLVSYALARAESSIHSESSFSIWFLTHPCCACLLFNSSNKFSMDFCVPSQRIYRLSMDIICWLLFTNSSNIFCEYDWSLHIGLALNETCSNEGKFRLDERCDTCINDDISLLSKLIHSNFIKFDNVCSLRMRLFEASNLFNFGSADNADKSSILLNDTSNVTKFWHLAKILMLSNFSPLNDKWNIICSS